MEIDPVADTPRDDLGSDAPNQDETFGSIPELPSPNQRWTVLRKAAVVEAVRSARVSIAAICGLYNLSVDEFVAWERDLDLHGIPGLRITRYQIYRDTAKRKA